MHVTSPAPRDVWSELVDSDPTSFVYQSPKGIDALCTEAGRRDASRLYEFADGRRLVLPLYRDGRLPGLLATETTPRIGSLVSADPVRPDELRAIVEDLAGRGLMRVSLYPGALHGEAWTEAVPEGVARTAHRAHVIDLEGGFDAVAKGFNSQARRSVRKAEKADLEVELGHGARLLPELYGLYLASLRRWSDDRDESRLVAYLRSQRAPSMEKLERRLEALGDLARVWVARVDGAAAAAILVLQDANAHYTMGAMDRELAGPTRASFLLQKLAIEDACASGCRYYNMGETGTSASLARFKTQFGAVPYAYSSYRIERIPLTSMQRRVGRLINDTASRRAGNGVKAAANGA